MSIISFLISCKKNFVSADASNKGILGKWNIVSDSTSSGVGLANHAVSYAGQPGDYFDFINDSVIYTREGSVLDTLSYSLTSDTTIIISSFGITLNGILQPCEINDLTEHSLTIAPDINTPGGVFGRKLSLHR